MAPSLARKGKKNDGNLLDAGGKTIYETVLKIQK